MPKERYMCQLCANHGHYNQPKKGHKRNCPNRNCTCSLCSLNLKRRALDQMERQWRLNSGGGGAATKMSIEEEQQRQEEEEGGKDGDGMASQGQPISLLAVGWRRPIRRQAVVAEDVQRRCRKARKKPAAAGGNWDLQQETALPAPNCSDDFVAVHFLAQIVEAEKARTALQHLAREQQRQEQQRNPTTQQQHAFHSIELLLMSGGERRRNQLQS